MGLMKHFPLNFKLVCDVVPKDINGAAQGGNYTFTSLRNYHSATVLIVVGVHSGASTAVTLKQAKNVEGGGNKALGFTKYYELKPLASPPETSDRWNEKTATNNTFNLAANTVFAIPIQHGMLDVTNSYDCIRPEIAAAGASTLLTCMIVLGEGVFGIAGDTLQVPSAKVNRMPY